MIYANWKNGRLTVSVLKGNLSGIVLIHRTGNRLTSMDFNAGTGRRVVGMRDRPLAVQWVPAAQVEDNYAEDAGMLGS